MTNKKLLLLIPPVTIVLVGLLFINLEASEGDQYDILIRELREDVNQMVFDSDDNYTSNDVQRIQEKHDQTLENMITAIEIDTNRPLSFDERNALKDYILNEELKYNSNLLDDTKILNSTSGRELETNNPELMGYFFPYVYASHKSSTCEVQQKIILFKQSRIDIKGGELNGHTFNGKNKLESVNRTILNDCRVKYDLTFKDEDHPTLDAYYDMARESYYKRIKDIEKFYVQNGNEIKYHNIWSDDKSYDYLKLGLFGQHAYHTGDFGRIMYVANTWNHAMDTENTNPDLRQKLLRFR